MKIKILKILLSQLEEDYCYFNNNWNNGTNPDRNKLILFVECELQLHFTAKKKNQPITFLILFE